MKKLFLIFLLLCLCCKNEPLVDPRIWGEALERELSFRKEMQGQVGDPVEDPELSRREQSRREGCGKWIKPKATLGMDVIDGSIVRTYTFEYESWNKIDSVWVSCPKEADVETVWTHASRDAKPCPAETVYVPYDEEQAKKDPSRVKDYDYYYSRTKTEFFFLALYFFEKWQECIAEPDTCGYWKWSNCIPCKQ